MRILIVGSGGREHAISWALNRSSRETTLFVAPGNAGTAQIATNVSINADDIDGLLEFATRENIELTIVGPEVPLVMGIVDRFEENKLPIVGPTANAARLEGSKAFAKAFMDKYNIPTASHRKFDATEWDYAESYVLNHSKPVVLKADGLAAGKGVLICESDKDAVEGLKQILLDEAFGDAGSEVVVESFMQGEEASVFAITDGTDYVVLSPAQDHKRVGDGDTGPNTGGMGAYAPAPVMDDELMARVATEIIEPVLAGMTAEGSPYKGILYCGLMLTTDGPKVVEFNCRFGDPETQVVLPLIQSDFVELMERVATGTIGGYRLSLSKDSCACVVLASGGYPGAYEKGKVISGLGEPDNKTMIFHAGTSRQSEGRIVTAGGRVLAATAVGSSLSEAVSTAYQAANRISFEGMFYRNDIAWRGLKRQSGSR